MRWFHTCHTVCLFCTVGVFNWTLESVIEFDWLIDIFQNNVQTFRFTTKEINIIDRKSGLALHLPTVHVIVNYAKSIFFLTKTIAFHIYFKFQISLFP